MIELVFDDKTIAVPVDDIDQVDGLEGYDAYDVTTFADFAKGVLHKYLMVKKSTDRYTVDVETGSFVQKTLKERRVCADITKTAEIFIDGVHMKSPDSIMYHVNLCIDPISGEIAFFRYVQISWVPKTIVLDSVRQLLINDEFEISIECDGIRESFEAEAAILEPAGDMICMWVQECDFKSYDDIKNDELTMQMLKGMKNHENPESNIN